jgi:hypothetical protein
VESFPTLLRMETEVVSAVSMCLNYLMWLLTQGEFIKLPYYKCMKIVNY